MVALPDVLDMLAELITLTTLDEQSPQSFKVRAYEKARRALADHPGDITAMTMAELTSISGVGKATATKVREFLDTGRVDKLDRLRVAYPPTVVELSRIPGVGPKTLALMRRELGIENLDQLRAAIAEGRLRTLPGLGETSEVKMAQAIDRLGLIGKQRRIPIADALPVARRWVEVLEQMPEVERAMCCGSLRRFAETVADIDITVASTHGPSVMAAVRERPEVAEVIGSGDTKTSVLLASGPQIDVRVVAPEVFGAATLYFTGSKAHNIALRQRALARGWSLSEYGLVRLLDDQGEELAVDERELLAARHEADIYSMLGLVEVPPPLREGHGEIERAAGGGFGNLIQVADIRGDLHYHTDRSGDGRSSVEDMVAVAAARGYEYLAITDHGVDLAINGSTAAEMLEHRDHIARVQESYPGLHLLWGCELNIGPEGNLDYDADFRALFDYTVASVHSHFDLPVIDQTERLIRAIADPSVDSIGHLTGRYIGRRPGIELDIEAVLDALAHHDVALEVNGALDRLDASSEVVRRAVEREVKLVINTDSHHTSELGRIEYGVLTAQRGGAPRDLVINTWEPDRFLDWVASHRT